MSSNIVREYLRFERDWTMIEDPSVSCVEARKVRWVLIYAMLQVLVSIAKVPDEVRDTDGVTYPLCCQTAGTPPWIAKKSMLKKPRQASEPPTPMSEITDPVQDYTDLKPSPLRVPQTTPTPSTPQRSNLTLTLPLRAPQPIRSASIEFLDKAASSGLLTPPALERTRALSLHTPSMTSLNNNKTPTQEDVPDLPRRKNSGSSTDPSSPSSSEADGHSGWSASSSEDGMEHNSVRETDSNYGDDEDEELHDTGLKAANANNGRSPKKVPSNSSMMRYNPEVEQFLSS